MFLQYNPSIINSNSEGKRKLNSSSYRGQLNIQFAVLITDSLLIFQHFSIQYSADLTYLVRNCNTIIHSYHITVIRSGHDCQVCNLFVALKNQVAVLLVLVFKSDYMTRRANGIFQWTP